MPIYEYTCQQCGTTFDALRSFQEADQVLACTRCHSQQTKRQLSTFFSSSRGSETSQASSGAGCGGCSGGSCSTCRH